MRDLLIPLGLAALLALGGPALAQETDAAPAEDQQPKAEAYIKDTFQKWQVFCVKFPEGREDCNMRQVIVDDNGGPVSSAELIPLPADAPSAALVEIGTPLNTLLSEDLRLAIDTADPKRYRFNFCTTRGCFARFPLEASEIRAMKAGREAKISIVILTGENKVSQVTIPLSLSGFTAAYDLVSELQAR
ncbi:Invasion associated family protein [Rhodovulum sp. P5]|uniref:invasion associated locus B family protein n=1 Tax=Rhodovulum sp. P5 TaxID=1564506 RepID=UPI0009C3CF75|nr:invasion associated locus B family protein [Rhodovulum sp. P5]ARE38401.1 Invasion associated family protein [Rhodovulum sp. P5]